MGRRRARRVAGRAAQRERAALGRARSVRPRRASTRLRSAPSSRARRRSACAEQELGGGREAGAPCAERRDAAVAACRRGSGPDSRRRRRRRRRRPRGSRRQHACCHGWRSTSRTTTTGRRSGLACDGARARLGRLSVSVDRLDVGAQLAAGSTRDRVTAARRRPRRALELDDEQRPSRRRRCPGRGARAAPPPGRARRTAARPRPRAAHGTWIAATRPAASASRSSSSRPSRTAATIAARTRATWPSSMSCPRQSASAPASERLDGALLHPHGRAHGLHLERVGDDRAGESELVAQQPGELGAAERGRHVVDRRDDEVGRHDRARAGGDRRPERRAARPPAAPRASPRRRAGRGASRRRWRRGRESASRRRRRRPPGGRSRTRPTWRETSAGSEPNERTPITGLSGFALMSATGARSSVMPAARSSSARARAICSVSATSSIAPSARWAGHRAARLGLEAGDVAALLVDRDDRRRRDTRSDSVSAWSCSGSATLRAKRTTPPRPSSSSRRSQSRRRRAGEPGQDAPVRQAFERVAHPLVAPAVRPKAILRWTSRKKATTGIAVSVEAAISPPQSVLRLVP